MTRADRMRAGMRALAAFTLALAACATTVPGAAAQPFDQAAARELQDTLPPLTEDLSPQTRAVAEAYRTHYDLRFEGGSSWRIGTVQASGYEIAVQLFVPAPSPGGVAVLLHGYLDHAGLNHEAVRALLAQGYAVVVPDLPGHGLSSGPRGEIDEFREYGRVLDRVLAEALPALDTVLQERDPAHGGTESLPLVGVGHSTGAAALIEHLEHYDGSYDALIFAAPLVRIWLWPLAQVGIRIGAPLFETVGRRLEAASSNPEFIEFSEKHDPLGVYRVPLSWAVTYLEWEERAREYQPRQVPLLMVFAENDTVVDNEYNRAYLQERFPINRAVTVERARHSLFNEPQPLRSEVFEAIEHFLDSMLVSPGERRP